MYTSKNMHNSKMNENEQCGIIQYNNTSAVIISHRAASILGFQKPWKMMCKRKELEEELQDFHKRIRKCECIQGNQSSEPVMYMCEMKEKVQWIKFIVYEYQDYGFTLVFDVSEQILEKQQLEYDRDHDTLTPLYNRSAFQREVEHLLQSEDCTIAAMVFWDLDQLKLINDILGHDSGDQIIVETAAILQEEEDAHCITCRMAGDEFLSFYHHFESQEELQKRIDRCHNRIQYHEVRFPDNSHSMLSISAGVSWYPLHGNTYLSLLSCADHAMYRMKKEGRGNVCQFDQKSYEQRGEVLKKNMEFDEVLNENKIRYAFQPIVDARTAEVFAYEALMRPQGKRLTTPEDILNCANERAQLYRVEVITWQQAICQFAQQCSSFPNTKLFINSLPQVPLLKSVMNDLEQRFPQIMPRIVMELLESEILEKNTFGEKQRFLKRWGGEIAIDDYGSGYNQELRLLQLKIHYIKIDAQLIFGIAKDEMRQELVCNIITFAHHHNIRIIAEGIENQADLQYVLSKGIDMVQGFYIGKPKFTLQDIGEGVKQEIIERFRRNEQDGEDS